MFSNRRITLTAALLLLFTGMAQAAPVSDLSLGQTGLIEFESITPANIGEFVRKQTTTKAVINGRLTFPANYSGKVPAMVVAHHCGGIENKVLHLADMLNKLGIATFVPDSFNPRGYPAPPGVCTSSTLSNTAAIADALYALKLLATHPNIDANRIGIIGQSYGGGAVYTTAFEEARRAVIDGPLKFAAHINMYPSGCSSRYWSNNTTKAPMLTLLGGADTWTPAGPCMDFDIEIRSLGTPVTTIVYPGAYHSWDGPETLMQDPAWSSLENCYWGYRMDTLKSERYDGSGIVFTSSTAVSDYIKDCKKTGSASIKGDAATKAAAERDITDFLARVFKLTNVATSTSQPDRIFNYLEDNFASYIAPAGAASQSTGGYYYRHYRKTNSYIATNGGKVYYLPAGASTPIEVPGGNEAAWLSTAVSKGY